MEMRKKGIIIRPIHIKYRFTSEECFAFLLGLIWADDILLTYVRAVLLRIPYLSDYREHIMSILFLVALIPALPYMAKQIHPVVVVAYLSIASVYFLNILLFPQNKVALEENLIPFLFKSLPLVFIGEGVKLKKHYRMLYSLSVLTVLVRFVHLLLEPDNNIDGDMHSSYLLLPHVCMVIVETLSQRNFMNFSTSILGGFLTISFGTRGPVLCILILVALYMVLFKKIQKHIGLFLILTTVIICFVFFYETIVQLILMLIQRMGMSTRVISMLLSGDIASSTGRDIIQGRLMEAVSNNWFGYGIAADRTIAGQYAHNILIELWVSYGVFVGTILFIVPASYTVMLLIRKSKNNACEDGFILALISAHVVRLMLSGSYLTEENLYLLLGVIIAEYRALNVERLIKQGVHNESMCSCI